MSRAVVIPVEGPPSKIDLATDPTQGLDQLQKIVGGYVEVVGFEYPSTEGTHGLLMWVNEEGLLEGLPRNPRASALAHQPIVGDVVITGEVDRHEQASAVDEDVAAGLLQDRPVTIATPEHRDLFTAYVVGSLEHLPTDPASDWDKLQPDKRWALVLITAIVMLADQLGVTEEEAREIVKPWIADATDKPGHPLWQALVAVWTKAKEGQTAPKDGSHRLRSMRDIL